LRTISDVAKYTERIKRLASCVARGERVADIGPDHGYLGIWLAGQGVTGRVIMTDIAEGPLAIARRNAEAASGLSVIPGSPSWQSPGGRDPESPVGFDFRLGDGLAPLEPGEVDTVVIAGMGGETIIGILEADMEKTRSFPKYVLQPRTKAELLREWLGDAGFRIIAEDTVPERGRPCEIIVAGVKRCEQEKSL
jgi:tRNA (adenine22-N1)-methyltransferase